MSTQPAPEYREVYLNALRLAAQGQWMDAAAVARPLADEGDPLAALITAQYLMNAGNFVEGKTYALQVAKAGNGVLAQNYFANLWGHPEHRDDAIRFLKLAMDAGAPVDPLGH